jgi:hypothetical protein
MQRTAPARTAMKVKAQGPGRPRVHVETWAKVSVVLFDRQVTHLDRLAKKARRQGHRSMTRACIIRGLIDGLLNSGLDLPSIGSEAQIRDHVSSRLKDS